MYILREYNALSNHLSKPPASPVAAAGGAQYVFTQTACLERLGTEQPHATHVHVCGSG